MASNVKISKGYKYFGNWRFYTLVLLPILLMPILFIEDNDMVEWKGKTRQSTKFKCAYVILLMAAFWMVEALPLAITALLPVVLFPLLGINSTSAVSINYMKETNMMFVGGLIIALAVEHCNLHKRVALKVMSIVGCSPMRLMLGIMLTTMVLSMWMSNTATTAMMVPIVLAVLESLHPEEDSTSSRSESLPKINASPSVSVESVDAGHLGDDIVPVNTDWMSECKKRRLQIEKMYLFAIAYSSNIGGTGVVTGTAPNLFVFEIIQNQKIGQNGKYTDLTFASWMLYNCPAMLINVIIAWLYLALIFLGLPSYMKFGKKNPPDFQPSEQSRDKVAKMLKEKYDDLGGISFHELAVTSVFLLAVSLWIFRDPKFVMGWAEYYTSVKVGDSTAAILAVTLLFIIPRNLSSFVGGPTETLMEWKYVQDNLPWGVVLLLGGGFALSEASDISGLSLWIGGKLNGLEGMDERGILLLVMILTAMITEVASNTATANIIIPILLTLSKNLNLHPLYLTLPAAVTCSYAFMLPVATPPNAIVFGASRGRMKIMDMIRCGAFLNFSCVTVLFLVNISFGSLIFNYGDYVYPNATLA